MAKKKKTDDENLNEEFNDDSLDDISDADDSFGLPDVELEPLDRDESSESSDEEEPAPEESEEVAAESSEEEPEAVSEYEEETVDEGSDHGDGGDGGNDGDGGDGGDDDEYKSYVPPKGDSIAPKLIVFGVILVVVGGLIWYFVFYKPGQDAKIKAQQEQVEKARQDSLAAVRAEQDRIAAEQAAREAEAQAAAEAEAEPELGTVTTISERTGRYYVVIGSFVDDDLASDYGGKLAPDGISTSIIPPFGGKQFYRLAIADHGSFAEAQSNADELKGTYGEGLWVLKY